MTSEEKDVAVRLERQRKMGELAKMPSFLEEVDALLGDCDLEIFAEEWMALTIVNRAKELVLAMHLGEMVVEPAREELRAYYDRKREFFLDETVVGDDEGLENLDELLDLDEKG